MKILIVGIGAIGSNLATSLVPDLKGEHEITLLDCDKVEERNITPGTQKYTPDQIDLLKVEALQFNLYKWYQRKVHILDKNIFDMGLLDLEDYDIVIDCLDNNRARNRLYMHGERNEANVLHVGFSDNFTFAIEWNENYKVPTDITSGMDICEMPGAAAFVNTVSSMGTLVVEEFIQKSKKMDIVGGKFIHSVVQ